MQSIANKKCFNRSGHPVSQFCWQSDDAVLQKSVTIPLLLLWMILAINTWRSFYPFSEFAFFTILAATAFARPRNLPYLAILPLFTPFTFQLSRPYVIIFAIFAVVAVFSRRLHNLGRIVVVPLAKYAVLFTIYYAFACLWSPEFHAAITNAGANFQALAFLLILLLFLDSTAAVITAMRVIICFASLAFFISLANYLWRDHMWITEYVQLITSGFDWDPIEKYSVMFGKIILAGRIIFAGAEPNYWGAQLQFPLWLAIGMLHSSDNLKQKLFWLTASALILMSILGTYSRASFLTVITVGVIYAIRQRIRGLLPLIILVVVGFVMTLYYPEMVERYTGIQEDITTRGGSGRLELWGKALSMWVASPVWGQGLYSFVKQYGAVHNTYMELLAELGLIGLGLYLTVIHIGVHSWYRITVIARRIGDRKLACLAEGGFLGSIATYININSITAQDVKFVWLPAILGFAFYDHMRKQINIFRAGTIGLEISPGHHTSNGENEV
jgi:hypothetical protein